MAANSEVCMTGSVDDFLAACLSPPSVRGPRQWWELGGEEQSVQSSIKAPENPMTAETTKAEMALVNPELKASLLQQVKAYDGRLSHVQAAVDQTFRESGSAWQSIDSVRSVIDDLFVRVVALEEDQREVRGLLVLRPAQTGATAKPAAKEQSNDYLTSLRTLVKHRLHLVHDEFRSIDSLPSIDHWRSRTLNVIQLPVTNPQSALKQAIALRSCLRSPATHQELLRHPLPSEARAVLANIAQTIIDTLSFHMTPNLEPSASNMATQELNTSKMGQSGYMNTNATPKGPPATRANRTAIIETYAQGMLHGRENKRTASVAGMDDAHPCKDALSIDRRTPSTPDQTLVEANKKRCYALQSESDPSCTFCCCPPRLNFSDLHHVPHSHRLHDERQSSALQGSQVKLTALRGAMEQAGLVPRERPAAASMLPTVDARHGFHPQRAAMLADARKDSNEETTDETKFDTWRWRDPQEHRSKSKGMPDGLFYPRGLLSYDN